MKQLQTTLPGLICAVQVAERGGFSAAAKALNLSAAAVSKNVAALEATLQVRLFNRTTRTVALTEEGRVFIEQARAGLALLEDAATQASARLTPQGLVRVNCSVGFGRRYVLPALPAFFRAHPRVQIDLALNDQAVDLIAQGFDVGIRGGSQPPEGMVARKLCQIPSVLVASPNYLHKRGVPQTPADLAQHDLIRVRFLNGKMYPWVFQAAAVKTRGHANQARKSPQAKPNVALHFDSAIRLFISDPEVVLDAALLDLGIARMGRHHAHAAIESGALVEVLKAAQVPSETTMTMFYPHRAGLAPRVRVFVEHLAAALAQEPSLQAPKRK